MNKPIPKALYHCANRNDTEPYVYPAEDIYWSETNQQWVCEECFYNARDTTKETPRLTLAQYLEEQKGKE